MTAREALDRLANAAKADLVAAGPLGWRLVPRAPRVVPLRVRRPKVAPVMAPVEGAEIVVTGSKRDVRLRDFAGQVALLDGTELALGGAGGTDAILARLASVSSMHLGPAATSCSSAASPIPVSPGRRRRRWASISATCG